jgi:hypothetical protein
VAIAYLILQIQRPRALTRLNFRSRFAFLRGDRLYFCRSCWRDTDTLFQKECSDNPNRFRNKTISRLRLRFSVEGAGEPAPAPQTMTPVKASTMRSM